MSSTGKRYKICYLWSKLWTIGCEYSYHTIWNIWKERSLYL